VLAWGWDGAGLFLAVGRLMFGECRDLDVLILPGVVTRNELALVKPTKRSLYVNLAVREHLCLYPQGTIL
jgi:hypothetical protein